MAKWIIRSFAFVAYLGSAGAVQAATLTVCASGCTHTNTQLQTAIDAAVSGDTILLQQSFTYVGTFLLRQKAGTTDVVIRTGVSSTGTVLSTALFPAANIRITPTYTTVLAKVQPSTNNFPAFRTVFPAETGSGCGAAPCVASYWKLQWLELIPNAWAGSTLVTFGSNDTGGGLPAGDTQDTLTEEPHHLTMDQVYVRGDPVTGQERGMLIAARNVLVQNCYFKDIKTVSDKAAIWIDNSSGTIDLINNYIEGGTEAIIFGGDLPRMAHSTTVAASPAPTTTTFDLAVAPKDFLLVGNGISVVVAGVKRYTHVTAIAGTSLTVEALPSAPSAGAAVNYSVVPKNGNVRYNHLFKPPDWRNPILATPQSVTATAALTGGTLAAGTYSYRVTARVIVSGNQPARSGASAEVAATVASGTTGSVAISWASVPNATEYYIYGRSAGGENIRFSVTTSACTGGTCTFTDTGAAGTSEAVPTSSGTVWMMKNLFELKKYHTLTVEKNLMEYSWQGGQTGFAVLLTVLNNSDAVDGNDSTVVRNITFQYNRIRHAVAAMQLTGRPADGDIGDRTRDITILHNLFEDLGTAWGAKENTFIITSGSHVAFAAPEKRGPLNVLINHNTFINAAGKSDIIFDLYQGGEQHECENCDFTNNMIRRVDYGLRSNSPGLIAEGQTSFDAGTDATSSWLNNVVVGATCSIYPGAPASSWCPTETTFQSAFANYPGNDFTVTSIWTTAATDATAVGAHPSLIDPGTDIALSGNNSGGPIIEPPVITTTSLPTAVRNAVYTTTLVASGGTKPYTWSLASGTLPTGLTLGAQSGLISGTPTTVGPSTFTIRVTGADTGTSTAQFTLTVQELLSPFVRPERVNWGEMGSFRRVGCPTAQTEEVRVGDLCYDLADGGVYKATATAPNIVWSAVATAGGSSPQNLVFIAGASVTHSDIPAGGAEFPGANRNRVKANLVGYTQCALTAYFSAPGISTTDLVIQYWDGALWQSSGISVLVGASGGLKEGTYQTLVSGARLDLVTLRPFLDDGDGLVDATATTIHMTCKP